MRPCLIGVVLALATSAAAGPRFTHTASHDPAFATAEQRWSAAHDAAGWRAAAAAFFAITNSAAESDADRLAAARSGWAAARNALGSDLRAQVDSKTLDRKPAPRPLSADEALFVHDAELYEHLDRGAAEAVVAEFLRANVLRRADQLEAANALYLDIVATHPEHEVAEFAANLALDTFNRLEQYDQLVALADRLHADKAFIAHRPELAQLLHRIHLMALRNAEPRFVGPHDPPTYAEYAARGERYLDAIEPGEPGGDEVLYNSMTSFEDARAYTRALEVGARILADYRTSRLTSRVVARIARIEADLGRYADAARDLERYAAIAPGERDTFDALGDALLYRVGLGDLDRAARDLDALAKAPHVRADELARATVGLARAELDAGLRAAALRHARAVNPRDAAPVALGLVLAELACPVELADELCPRPRDPKLLAHAESVLRRATDADDPDDTGRRVLVDLAVEASEVREVEDAKLRYRELTGDASATRVIAHERLGRLATLAGNADEAAAEFALCIAEARDRMLGAAWLERCERERAALRKPPVVSPLLEHVRAVRSGDVTALEQL